jgi:hypothetical protein
VAVEACGRRQEELYNSFNRLTSVNRTDESGKNAHVLIACFTYESLGHRTAAVYDTCGDGVPTNESIDLYRDDMAWAGEGTCGVRRMSGGALDCPQRRGCGGGAMREV